MASYIMLHCLPTGVSFVLGIDRGSVTSIRTIKTVLRQVIYASTPVDNAGLEPVGYTTPVRLFIPRVYKKGQTGVKTLIHFDELSINSEGYPYPKDETGREWYWRWPPEGAILDTPSKFGASGYASRLYCIQAPASEDFNFGNGDFCVAGWRVLPSAGFGSGSVYTANTPYLMIWQLDVAPFYPRLEFSTYKGLSAIVTGNSSGGSLWWRFSDGDEIYELGEDDNLSGDLFDDKYHYFAFARSGNVFSMYVDRERKAHGTYNITLPFNVSYYDEEDWNFYYCYRSSAPV